MPAKRTTADCPVSGRDAEGDGSELRDENVTVRQDVPTARILIVDDNPAIHDDFRKILLASSRDDVELVTLERELFGSSGRDPEPAITTRAAKFSLYSVFQGEQAVAATRDALEDGQPFQLAFVDGRMPPGISGIDTIAALWEVDPRLQVVVCTAFSDHTWSDIVRKLGHSDGLLVLRKPFDGIEVLQLAHALTRKWILGHAVRQRLDDLEVVVSSRTQALEEANEQLLLQIDQRTRAENDFRHLATHDPVTGIPNRVFLRERMLATLTRAQRTKSKAALVLVDLDHFKEVNDAYGHPAGDELLRAVAARLHSCVRSADVVARIGGDEFALLLEDIASPEEAALVAKRALKACSEPFMVSGHAVHTPPSMGIAIFPDDGSDPEELLKSADLAMYEAKESGRATYRYYAKDMLAISHEKLRLREQMLHAIERSELRVWYQPLVDLRTGEVSAMEALIRWQHPELGLVPPLKFIPAAEKSGLIVPIGAFVVQTACAQLATWRKLGLDLSMAVNVSVREVQAPGFIEMVTRALAAAELEPHLLELELTESDAMREPEQFAAILNAVAAMGVRIAIDDFGSGYSSLMRLRQMPINVLKVDRFLIQDIVSSPRDTAIVGAVVAMGRSLDLTVVAEGVETSAQLETLRNLRWDHAVATPCDRVQGYLISKPLPSEEATAWALAARDGKALQRTGS